jgi:arylsulfatase A-like enzyme
VHGFDEFYGNLYHLDAEDEPDQPDYPNDDPASCSDSPAMLGGYSVSYSPRAVSHSRNENNALTRVSMVGDTGFEPVTSSV